MGLSASKRVSNSLQNSSEFNSACDSVYDDCLSLSQHAFAGVKPYQLFSAVERLHASLSPSVPLIKNWVKSPPTRLQVDKAFKIVSTRRSGEKESEIVLGNEEFKEFSVEVFSDAVVSCAGKELLKRVPVGALGIAGVGAVVKPGKELIAEVTWPSVHFSSDETVACRLATNEIQSFDPRDFSKGFVNRLRVPGIAALELSKAPGSYVAAFVPESKGMPASVQIYACGKDLQSQPVARRSFFRCSTVQLSWNSGSTGLLVVVQSDVDKTNQSYYGESKLNYLTTDGAHEGLVPLRKEGPIHDVQWSYSGKEFAVVYGFMPAMATVFDKKCNPLLELGTGPYNTIRWNPLGNFICLAGFGNLPGDMAFWDYREKKQLGTTRAELSVTSEWSPDGRYFMTATTAPRLQVDNGVKVFHHNGSLYFKKMFDRLYQVDWKPESVEKFGDIEDLVKAVSSVKIDEAKVPGKGSKATQAAPKATQAVPKATPANPPAAKPAAYRPPHAKAAAVVQAELFGASPSGELSKNALKNKKKREKKKQAEAASAAGGS